MGAADFVPTRYKKARPHYANAPNRGNLVSDFNSLKITELLMLQLVTFS